MNKIKQAIERVGLSYEEYTKHKNLAYIFATYAENQYMQAEDILRQTNEYVLNNKQMFTKLNNLTKKLLKRTENLDEKYDEAFYNSVDFAGKIVDVVSDIRLSKEDEIKIVSYIKNNFR